MLAVAKVGIEKGVKLIERPEPKIKRGTDVLVEVGACGICGTDLEMYESSEDRMSYMAPAGWPRVLGHEVAGTVLEIGKDVTAFKQGDRVVCEVAPSCGVCFYCKRGQPNLCDKRGGGVIGATVDGGLAKHVLISSSTLYKIPGAIPMEEASVLVTLGTALRAIERSHFKPGDTVVIFGPGPVGILGAMLLKLGGIQTLVVAGLPMSRERLKVAAQIGAQTVEVAGDNLRKHVLELTSGRGADVVFDFAGGGKVLSEAVKVVRPGGEVVVTGQRDAAEFDPRIIARKELTILGTRARVPSTWDRAINLVSNRAIDVKKVITHVLPLQDYEKAFQLLFGEKALKVIIVP